MLAALGHALFPVARDLVEPVDDDDMGELLDAVEQPRQVVVQRDLRFDLGQPPVCGFFTGDFT